MCSARIHTSTGVKAEGTEHAPPNLRKLMTLDRPGTHFKCDMSNLLKTYAEHIGSGLIYGYRS